MNRTYTVQENCVVRGMLLNETNEIVIGRGYRAKRIPLSRQNPPNVADILNGIGLILEANIMVLRTDNGEKYVLTEPEESERILVVVRTNNHAIGHVFEGQEIIYTEIGNWSASHLSLKKLSPYISIRAVGEDPIRSMTWKDGVITMDVGDVLHTTNQKGEGGTFLYTSREKGLVKV
jgi:hypothetical protein